MAEVDNNLLLAVALMERVRSQLKEDKREQLSAINLTTIKQTLDQVVMRLNKASISDIYILGAIVDVSDNIEVLTADASYKETDSDTKDIFTKKLIGSLEQLYIVAGKYYSVNQFDYSIRLQPLLCRIVDKCVAEGIYFGVEV